MNTTAVRILNVIVNALMIFVIAIYSYKNFTSKHLAYLVTIFALLSPLGVYIGLFQLSVSLSIMFIFLALLFEKRAVLFYLFLFIAILSSWVSLPLVISVLINNYLKQKKNSDYHQQIWLPAFILVLFFTFSLGGKSFFNYLYRNSIFKEVNPSSYTYIIDKKLTYGPTYDSPLIYDGVNYTRIAYNKLYFACKIFFENIVSKFDYELLTSSHLSQEVLSNYFISAVGFVKIYYWQIILVFYGLITLFKQDNRELKFLIYGSSLSFLLFNTNESLSYLFLIIILAEAYAVNRLVLSDFRLKYFILCILLLLYLGGTAHLFTILRSEDSRWISENDFRQYQIWTSVNKSDLDSNNLFVTDIIGEPIYYYLFYKNVDPNFFHNTVKYGNIDNSGLTTVDQLGNVKFASFKYYEQPRGPNELWIGLSGELLGSFKKSSDVEEIFDGIIIKKIKDVRTNRTDLGNEIWFVKTTL